MSMVARRKRAFAPRYDLSATLMNLRPANLSSRFGG